MKKFVKIVVAAVVVLAMPVVGLKCWSARNSTYKFGIVVDDYRDIISEPAEYFAINRNVNKYSWNSPIRLPHSDIEIKLEHLVVASEFDVELIPEISDTKKLMTMVESNSNRIISIEVENVIDGQPLERVCSYVYLRPREQDKGRYPGGWEIVKVEGDKLKVDRSSFGYADVFEFPASGAKSFLGFKGSMFERAGQAVKIQYWDADGKVQEAVYRFELDWYRYMTGFEKVMLST